VKKFFALLAAGLFTIGLAGCGGATSKPNPTPVKDTPTPPKDVVPPKDAPPKP